MGLDPLGFDRPAVFGANSRWMRLERVRRPDPPSGFTDRALFVVRISRPGPQGRNAVTLEAIQIALSLSNRRRTDLTLEHFSRIWASRS